MSARPVVDQGRLLCPDCRDVLGDRLANEEVYCRSVCGYTVSGHELRAMFEAPAPGLPGQEGQER